MKRNFSRLLWLLLLCAVQSVQAATPEESLKTISQASVGIIAFCEPSEVDELQIIGRPRVLSTNEARELAQIFGAEDSFFELKADGRKSGLRFFCLTHWDFKLVLTDARGSTDIAIRLCSGCQQVAVSLNEEKVDLPDLRGPAMAKLAKLLDIWFPGWAKTTEENRERWMKRKRPAR